jgi:quinol monooxygenase YgiN
MSETSQSTISADAPVATLINVFTVEPERQQALVDALSKATVELFVEMPGFVSANLHASLDGTAVINYAQWESAGHFTAMLKDPRAQRHMAEIMTIAATAEPRLTTVRGVHNALRPAPSAAAPRRLLWTRPTWPAGGRESRRGYRRAAAAPRGPSPRRWPPPRRRRRAPPTSTTASA